MAVAMHTEESMLRRLRHAGDEIRGLSSEAGGIAVDVGRIAREEALLAVDEVREGVREFAGASAWSAIAAVAAVLTLFWLPLPIVLGLAEVMPMWAAALVTVAVMALVAAAVSAIAVARFKKVSLLPRGAMERMKEDQRWLRQQLSGGHD